MNAITMIDERSHLHDWRDGQMTSAIELERANEIIHLTDAIETCLNQAEALVLHVCSAKLHGSIANLAHSLCAELNVIAAQTQRLSRHC